MKFPMSLLKECIDFNRSYTTSEITDKITQCGLEVENVVDLAGRYNNFCIAEVVDSEKHPESEKLSLCKVDIGGEILNIVCGANNVRKGIKVVLAKVGAIVPESGALIKKGLIRGRESYGMICSASELCLDPLKFGPSEGIVEIPIDAKLGMDFAEYANLKDPIFHIAITPNRGDACSLYGIARDLSAKGLGLVKFSALSEIETTQTLEIEIEETLKSSIKVAHFAKASLQKIPASSVFELETYDKTWGSCAVLPVDIVNYVMFLTGNPMHIYDAAKIEGSIKIRRSKAFEKFIPIKGEEVELPEGLVVVCDDSKILSLLGCMGDARSKTTNETTEVIIEALHVVPDEIIKSSRATSIKSDSSYRFERWVDPNSCLQSLNIVLSKLGISEASVYSYKTDFPNKIISFSIEDCKKLTNLEISSQRTEEILVALGFKVVSEKAGEFTVEVPSFRYDITIKENVIEELARIEGYEKVMPAPIGILKPVINWDITFDIKKILSQEMHEIITYSFFREGYFGMLSNCKNPISLLNPVAKELSVMRDSLIPNLLENVADCESKSYGCSKAFEVGTVFEGVNPEDQKINVAGCFSGILKEQTFLGKEEKMTIWYAKEKMIEVLSSNFGILEESIAFAPLQNKHFHTKQSFEVILGKTVIGILAAIHPFTLDKFEIKERVFVFELYLSKIPPKKQKARIYKEQLLPDVEREIAIVVKKDILFEKIARTIKKLHIPSIKEISVKDVFEDESRIGAQMKSIAIKFSIGQDKQTLTKEILDGQIIQSIIDALEKDCGAKIRDGETSR